MSVFVSYAHSDQFFVEKLVAGLRARGIESWWDDHLEAGDDWKVQLRTQIRDCPTFLSIVSPEFLASEWCQWELTQAITLSRFILPVLCRAGCALPPSIQGLQHLDLSGGPTEQDASRVVSRLVTLKQCGALDGAFGSDAPVGLPSRFVQPLPDRYKSVAQAYLRPATPGMNLLIWPPPTSVATDAEASPVVGVDFGTTTSAMAHWSKGAVRLVPNDLGETTTPSAVSIGFDGVPRVGRRALELLVQRPERGVIEPKRLLGHRVAEKFGGAVVLEVDGVSYRPVDLAALVFHKLRSDASAFFGADVRRLVLTAPAHFDHTQMAGLSEAAQLAGWDIRRVIPEPVAACLATRLESHHRTVAVYDLGGGTFDVSILGVGEGTVGLRVPVPQSKAPDLRLPSGFESGLPHEEDPFVLSPLPSEAFGGIGRGHS